MAESTLKSEGRHPSCDYKRTMRLGVERRRAERVKASGRCRRCSCAQAVLGRTLCVPCSGKVRIAVRTRRESNRKSGVCLTCGGDRSDATLCLDCRIKIIANARLKKAVASGTWLILKEKLVAQGFRCAYSGEPIVPGINASIDHIVPSSRGGSPEAHNLQWVSKIVNLMKTSMTHDEFIAMCKRISERFGAS